MDWGALIQIISDASNNTGQAVSTWASYDTKRKAIDRQEKAFSEEQRRTELEMQQVIGQAKAGAAASGVSMDSASIRNYLGFMESEMAKQADWTREQNAIDISNARTAADWELGGSIFLWMTGGSSKSMSSMASLGKSDEKKTAKEIETPEWGPSIAKDEAEALSTASAASDADYQDQYGVLT